MKAFERWCNRIKKKKKYIGMQWRTFEKLYSLKPLEWNLNARQIKTPTLDTLFSFSASSFSSLYSFRLNALGNKNARKKKQNKKKKKNQLIHAPSDYLTEKIPSIIIDKHVLKSESVLCYAILS